MFFVHMVHAAVGTILTALHLSYVTVLEARSATDQDPVGLSVTARAVSAAVNATHLHLEVEDLPECPDAWDSMKPNASFVQHRLCRDPGFDEFPQGKKCLRKDMWSIDHSDSSSSDEPHLPLLEAEDGEALCDSLPSSFTLPTAKPAAGCACGIWNLRSADFMYCTCDTCLVHEDVIGPKFACESILDLHFQTGYDHDRVFRGWILYSCPFDVWQLQASIHRDYHDQGMPLHLGPTCAKGREED